MSEYAMQRRDMRREDNGTARASGAEAGSLQLAGLARLLNKRPAVQQLRAMSASMQRRQMRLGASDDVAGELPLQMVHPAKGQFGLQSDPLAPVTEDSLKAEFGIAVMREIVDTELDDEEAEKREHMTRYFFAKGGAPSEALVLLKRFPDENKPLEIAYATTLVFGANAFSPELVEQIFPSKLDESRITRRTGIALEFIERGVSPADALTLLRKYRDNDKDLELAFQFLLENEGLYEAYTAHGSKGEIDEQKKALVNVDHEQRLRHYKIYEEASALNPLLEPQAIATKLLLKEELLGEKAPYSLVKQVTRENGFVLRVYARKAVAEKSGAKTWIGEIVKSLLDAQFLISRQPPLNIEIIIHDRMSRDVASTNGQGNFITVNIEEYQVEEFSPGQMIGLLAHELGVHSLDATTLTDKEARDEVRDKDKVVKGGYQGSPYTIGREGKDTRQQDDHLTIGRALLGQVSALPRLNMYESTMISLVESSEPAARQEIAAAYCIDIARILVFNDQPAINLSNLMKGAELISVAVAEWSRIKQKYVGKAIIQNINIDKSYITSSLVKLLRLVFRLKDQESFL